MLRLVWTGTELLTGDQGNVRATELVLLGDDWRLDEPTVESALRERGYSKKDTFATDEYLMISSKSKLGYPQLMFLKEQFPTTVAQVNAICDLLDQYK